MGVARLMVMVVLMTTVVHRVQMLVDGLDWSWCGVTVLVDVVGRQGGREPVGMVVAQGLMLVARIYGDTYEPAGQDVAMAVDYVHVGGHHPGRWIVVVQVGAVHGIHRLGAFLVVIASQGRRRCTCLNPAVADLLGRRRLCCVGVLLLGRESRWRSAQGSLLKLGAKVCLKLAVQT